jgi:hypothetical protein
MLNKGSCNFCKGLFLQSWGVRSYLYPENRRWGIINRFYRRQSGLRTIKGGICLGFLGAFWVLTQIMLLGYQRIVYSVGLKGSLSFLSFPNINDYSDSVKVETTPSSYRHKITLTFAKKRGFAAPKCFV